MALKILFFVFTMGLPATKTSHWNTLIVVNGDLLSVKSCEVRLTDTRTQPPSNVSRSFSYPRQALLILKIKKRAKTKLPDVPLRSTKSASFR